MKIYEVWRDGYDGSDETESFWFSKDSAEAQAHRLNEQHEGHAFSWQVLDHEVRDLPASDARKS